MSSFAVDWLNLLFRWAHMIVGIGWIGTSFYFIALDLSLRKRQAMRPGVAGTAWEVHGGGFYHVEKFTVAPDELPSDLIWYKWEAYLTWVTGFALLILQYYWNAETYLINPAVMPLLPAQAIIISIIGLAAGWIAYDLLCRSPIGRHTLPLAVIVFAMIVLAAYAYGQLLSGRGALIHVGAFIGTIMSFNVFAVIIPNQRKIAAALLAGQKPDPALGEVSKQRSVHNNYLTLPVLILMVSSHYPMLTGHPRAWVVVALIIVMGAGVRHFINRHDAHDPLSSFVWTLPVAAVALAAAVLMTAPRLDPELANLSVSEGEALSITARHCTVCHSVNPAHESFDEPPKDIVLGTIADLRRFAGPIIARAVTGDTMPLGNQTGMTADERRSLGAFLLNTPDGGR
jgi:uncharacterized membrane protein